MDNTSRSPDAALMLRRTRGPAHRLVLALVVLAACGGAESSPENEKQSSSATGGTCTSEIGTLLGRVHVMAAPGEPGSEPAPEAILELKRASDAEPLHGKANADGSYEFELPAGTWTVGGESADGWCTDTKPATAEVQPCAAASLDVVLDACTF